MDSHALLKRIESIESRVSFIESSETDSVGQAKAMRRELNDFGKRQAEVEDLLLSKGLVELKSPQAEEISAAEEPAVDDDDAELLVDLEASITQAV